MKAYEQVNLWFESLKKKDLEEVFSGLTDDPDLWWECANISDKNNLMNAYGARPNKPLGNIKEA